MSEEMNRLIPELSLWNDGAGIDVEGWLSCVGNYELAVAYGEFFWPRFVEHDGCVFRGEVHEQLYKDWMNQTKGNRTSVETVVNHVHILDMFPNVEDPPSREQIRFVGRKLSEMWEAKLKRDFPDSSITVSFCEEDSDDLLDYVLTFYQERGDQN